MIKKIAIILFSLGIVVTGAFGFRKLNYWERSAWIFRLNTTDQRFEGREGRPPGEFRGRPEGEFRDRSEGGRETFEGRGERGNRELTERSGREFMERPERAFRDTPEREFRDSTQREFRQRPDDRASFGPGDRGRGGHVRGDFRGGQKIRLRNVWWFLAVFSAFAAVTLYLDRAWLHIRKKKTHSTR